jgi:hypothetical protein
VDGTGSGVSCALRFGISCVVRVHSGLATSGLLRSRP